MSCKLMYQLNYERMLCHMVLECAAGVWCVLVPAGCWCARVCV